MNSGHEERTVKGLGFAVSLCGLIMMFAWVFDLPYVRSGSSQWIEMKFMTACCFFICGVMLWWIPEYRKGNTQPAQIILSASTLLLNLIMATLLVGTFFGIHTGIENFFIQEQSGAVSTVLLGAPSLITMISFILLSCAGILVMIEPFALRFFLRSIGICISVIGSLAVFGYMWDVPALYFSFPKISNPIAFNTSLLFMLCGIALIISSRYAYEQEERR